MSGGRAFHPTSALLVVAGGTLVAAAVAYNEAVAGLLHPTPLAHATALTIRQAQMVWGCVGIAAIAIGLLLRRVPSLRQATAREWVSRLMLVGITLLLPIGLLEFGLRPWVEQPRTTTLFERDEALGWRHRRGAVAEWEGAVVRINPKGLRGPELPYVKPRGVLRILWLGDSVTFGDKLGRDEDTFPFMTELLLEARDAVSVETVNAGVSGYSPWQELRFLRDEGVRYEPDIVVVGFVPNDVTELLDLRRFGGPWEGWQLWYTRSPLQQALGRSGIVHFARRLAARLEFGRDPQAGALGKEVLSVQALVDEPDRPDVQAAWRKALEDLEAILQVGREHRARVLLVAFPFAFQMEAASDEPAPQRVIAEFAAAHSIPFLDLLPRLRARAAQEGAETRDYFLDHVHLTTRGSQVVAEEIAALLREAGLAPPAGPDGVGGAS